MKINSERTRAALSITGEFSAAQLDQLLRDLALLRADLLPAVPEQLAGIGEETLVLVEDKPGLNIAARRGGGFRLWLRHRGYGWLAYQLDDQTAVGVASYISSRAGPGIDLVGDQVGHTH